MLLVLGIFLARYNIMIGDKFQSHMNPGTLLTFPSSLVQA